MFKRKDKEEKEYNKKVIEFCKDVTMDKIYNKQLTVIYDDIIPDMYINIPVDGKHIDSINYDIYANRLKKVRVTFPNGISEIFDIVDVDTYTVQNELYETEWDVPLIEVKYNDYVVRLSVIDLINDGVKVFLEDYEI